MKKKLKCQEGGELKAFPKMQVPQWPTFTGIDHQSLMNANPVQTTPPGVETNQANMQNKFQFGLNYGHIAASQGIQSIAAFLRNKQLEKQFRDYDKAQSSPLLQIPESPNTTTQSLYGTALLKKGGPSPDKAKEMLKDGTANGKKLTEKQKRYFQCVAHGGCKKQLGGEIEQEFEDEIMGNNIAEAQAEEQEEQIVTTPRETISEEELAILMSDPLEGLNLDENEVINPFSSPESTYTTSTSTPDIEAFKRRIASTEGAGYFSPTNIKDENGRPASSAFGRYQFVKGTRQKVRDMYFPEIPRQEFENLYKTSPLFQEQVMDKYSGYLLNKFQDPKVAATAFFLGEGAADRVNDPNYRPTPGNKTVGQYLKDAKFQTGGQIKTKGSANFKNRSRLEEKTPQADFANSKKPESIENYINTQKDVESWFSNYIQSPKYRERLEGMGHSPFGVDIIPHIVKDRLGRTKNPDITFTDGEESSGVVNNTIEYNPKIDQLHGTSSKYVVPHEMSHYISSMDTDGNYSDGWNALNLKETQEINKRNKFFHAYPEHDARANEMKSDFDALRYNLWKKGIYNASKEDFTPEHLKKIKDDKIFKDDDTIINRIFQYFNDKDIIWIMNNIAKNESQGTPTAQKGGLIAQASSDNTRVYNPGMAQYKVARLNPDQKAALAHGFKRPEELATNRTNNKRAQAAKERINSALFAVVDGEGNPVKTPIDKLAENKTWNSFADNLALPTLEVVSSVDGLAPLAKGSSAIFKVSKNLGRYFGDRIGPEAIKDGNAWLRNWYSHPKVKEKLEDFIEKPFPISADDARLSEFYHKYTAPKKVMNGDEWRQFKDMASRRRASTIAYDNFNRLLEGEDIVESGVGYSDNVLGSYSIHGNNATVDPSHPMFYKNKGFNILATTVHEGIHAITNGEKAMKPKHFDYVIDKMEIPLDKDGIANINYDAYLTNPTEVHARIGELRMNAGLKPGEKVDFMTAFNIMVDGKSGKTSVDRRFFDLIKDGTTGLKDLLNYLPAAAGVTAGAAMQQNQKADPLPKYQEGGPIAYNPNLATKDKNFQSWYKTNTLEGQNNIPYSDSLTYDYYSFFRNKAQGNIEDHFPDTFKRPNHPTFSNESIYSTPENPGGRWEGEKFIPKYEQGGYYYMDSKEIARLKRLGYEIESE